ncbi:MAG: beta-galactosidase [Anaerolineae bacterium]
MARTRRHRGGGGWAALAVGLLVATACSGPSAEPAGPRPVPIIVGVNADMSGRGALLAQSFFASAGVGYVRQQVSWATLEPDPGGFDWSTLDDEMAVARSHGVRVLLSLATSPSWARHDPPPDPSWRLCDDAAVTRAALGDRAPPTDPRDLARFTRALLLRYGDQVWALEVWPEANLLPNWRATGPDPEEYASLLDAVVAAARRTHPRVGIVSGGLAPTTDVGVCYMSDLVFLERLAVTGVLARVDAVGIEPFGLRSPPGEAPARERLNFRRAELLHEVAAEAGVEKPLWAVAWGWHAGGDTNTSVWGSHPPPTAARWLGEALALADARWPWLEAMFAWHLRPPGPVDAPAMGFALVGPQGQLTASGEALVRLAAGEAGPVPRLEARPGSWRKFFPLAFLASLGIAAIALRGARGAAPLRCGARRASWWGGLLGRGRPARVSAGLLVGWFGASAMVTGDLPGWTHHEPWLLPGPRGLAMILAAVCSVGLVALFAHRPDLGPAAAMTVAPLFAGPPLLVANRSVGAFEAVALVAVAGGALAWLG